MSQSLRVVAHMKAQPNKAEEMRTLLEGLVGPTHREDGCQHYELWQSVDDPHRFTFLEVWDSQEALDAHFKTDHLQAALAELPGVMEGELDLRRYGRVAGGAVTGS